MALFPRTRHDLEAQRRLVADLLRPWPSAQDLAHALGVSPSTVSHWLAGERSPDLILLRSACRETARRYPEVGPALAAALCRELLDLRGRWEAEDVGDVGTWLKESHDLTRLHGRLVEAVEAGDQVAIERLAERAHREVDEALTAARQQVASGGEA